MASTYLTRAQTSGSRTTATISVWLKRAGLGTNCDVYSACASNIPSGNPDDALHFNTNDTLTFTFYGDGTNGVDNGTLTTNRRFTDTNAWYHIVAVYDTTNSTSGDRLRLYINGVRETSFGTANYPSQNTNSGGMNNSSITLCLGQRGNSAQYFDGCMSHFHFIDGTAYNSDTFGSTDATTGEWKINTSPSVTYGTNGFFILKDGNSGTDQSGQSNNLTVGGGTLTKTEDCPSNVFATLNPLSTKSALSHGNTEAEHSTGGTTYETSTTTLGMTSGKYYCEAKITFDNNYPAFGITSTNSIEATKLESDWLGKTSNSYGYFLDGIIYNNGSSIASGQSTFATNDIIAMALDLDSTQNTLKFYKNGSLINTTNITTNSDGWLFGTTHNSSKTGGRSKFNFGNGYFRSDAVSSAGTNASGIGIFEYGVPSGYTALSTKGLNE
tara:strand:- start:1070 stop:2389 length:1320 start_codon:yes stop_codon:yes gene_type:complete